MRIRLRNIARREHTRYVCPLFAVDLDIAVRVKRHAQTFSQLCLRSRSLLAEQHLKFDALTPFGINRLELAVFPLYLIDLVTDHGDVRVAEPLDKFRLNVAFVLGVRQDRQMWCEALKL